MSERLYECTKITDLKDMLKKTGELYGKNIAYKIKMGEGKYKTITHKEVRDMIDALGTSLIKMGLKDKKIAVIGENRYEWEIAYLSVVCGTGIVVPLDKSLPQNEIKSLVERSEVEAIFYSKKYEEILKILKNNKIGKLKYLISMDLDETNEEIYSQKTLIEEGKILIEKGDVSFVQSKINSEKMSIMLFTSGTTSSSKAVALSHKNISSNLMDIASVLDVDENDVFLSFLPLHHVFECTVGFLFSLYKGAQTVFCDGIRHIFDNMNEYNVSVMASVPAIYERLFKIISRSLDKKGRKNELLEKEEKYKNSSMEEKREAFREIHDMLGGNVKLLISGAASLDPEIEIKYRRLGLNLVQGYGLTETSPVVAIGSKKYYKAGSIGKSLPSNKVKIIDANSENIGELLVKGPNVMLEYYGNEEATKEAIRDGWFHTGDLARIDEEGYIFICGRKKNVIVLKNGKNIFPEEMENLLNKIEGIDESFVFGKPVLEDKKDVKIFVKIIYNKEFFEGYDIEEIRKYLTQKVKEINKIMPPYKAIRGIIIGNEPLIKTTTGKIRRQDNLQVMKIGEKVCNLN